VTRYYTDAVLDSTNVTTVDGDQAAAAADRTVRCEGVSRVYRRGGGLFGGDADRLDVRALDDVSVGIYPGELTVVAGASGSGKSTLLHLLGALDVPSEGRVLVDGVDTADLSESERAALRLRRVGIVFQRFHLLPALTARSNVALPLLEQGVPRGERRSRAEARLEAVGMGDRVSHRPGELSGGEQQRVAVARALVTDPDLLIADEPTGELDTTTGARIIELLHEVAEDRSVVVASHDERVIAAADRVIELRDGSVVSDTR